MYTCKSGLHSWIDKDSASKCCNGWHQEIRIAQLSLGETLPADARSIIYEPGVMVGRVWVEDSPDATQEAQS